MPGVGSGLDERGPHRVRVGVAPTTMIMVQVVELADDGVAGQRHLGVHGPGQRQIAIRIELGGHGVHLSPPGPERAAAVVGAPAQCPVEGVAVPVGQARQHHPAEDLVARSGRYAAGHEAEAIADDLEPDPGDAALGEPRVLGPVGGHAGPARSRSTVVNASTPARQSSRSANSAGEWETPVGLRTKIIVAGIPALARIPASCPAPVPITGAESSSRLSRVINAGSKRVAEVHDSSETDPDRACDHVGDLGDGDPHAGQRPRPGRPARRSPHWGSRSPRPAAR